MESNVFDLIDIELGGTTERVLAGGRHLFPLLPQAFAGIDRVGVIGWGPQGRAQALNLRPLGAPFTFETNPRSSSRVRGR